MRRASVLFLIAAVLLTLGSSCRKRSSTFVVALGDNIRTIDPIGSPSVDAASERVRALMFNSLVKKDEKFDYVGDLASDIKQSSDGTVFTFTLRDGVKFHDGRTFSSADAKYTLDLVFSSSFAKSASFFEGSGADKKSYIKSVDAPDARTLVITLTHPWTGLLNNLVPVAMIPKDSYESQKTHPLGSGAFKFKNYDNSQQVLDLEANADYWEGAPHIPALRVRVIADTNALQAELRSGRVDIAPLPTSLSPDAIKQLGEDRNLQVLQFTGSNVTVLTFNCSQAPLNDVRVRQAIAYAVDRESLIRELLLGQAKLAHSILPEESWAYVPGQKYSFDPSMAKKLLDEAGLKDPDGDGPQFRFAKPLVYKVSGSSAAAKAYAGVIQNYLKNVGVPVSIETAELNTLFDELRRGNFQIFYGQWVGGNQDPIFFKDLFATSEIPTEARASRNRSRYSNKEVDALLDEAVNTFDREKAKQLYARVQEIVSREVPVLPLWYQANIVIARKSVGNINVDASGDWRFVRNLTVQQ
ncbi:MAG: peptide/nickel transport system substrate-binding protein [Pyrinomonadaceae bacterium]|jgi:peptide/nickel transport system substrate-binding protein|nr:peptide/nickel transport system substrate-binding protein [Pyrinomonadaceae bacterium]